MAQFSATWRAVVFLTTGVSGAPCVKVVDFGIAKQVDDTQALTQTGAILGSPLYMSPEQLRGSRDVDARSDIWALGVTLYQLLAGVTPFHADTLIAVVTMINLDPPTPLAAYRADVAPHLAVVLAQCFEKDPARRWPNVSAFAAELAPHGSAASAGYAARVAKVQQVDVVPSRPTTELRAPSDTSLVEAASASAARPALAPHVEAPAISEVAWRPPSSQSSLARISGAVAGALLVVVIPIAIYFGMQSRAGGRVEQPAVPGDASPPAVTPATVSAVTEPAETAPPDVPPAAPSASPLARIDPPLLTKTDPPRAGRSLAAGACR